jgi:hypothetical protein
MQLSLEQRQCHLAFYVIHMIEYKRGVMHTWGSRKHMAFKIEGQVASRIVIKVASRIVIKVASRIVIKVASRIVIRTLLTSCTQGILVQKMNMYEYMYFIFKIAK